MEPQKIWLPKEATDKHTFITGQTGSGKSELIKVLTHQHIKRDFQKCVVLIDPHGDLAKEILCIPMHRNFNVIYIDPALKQGFSPCINPFDILDSNDDEGIDILSQELARAFDSMIKDSSLSTQMTALLTPCIATLLRRPNSTFFDLQRFMNDEHNADLVELGKDTKNIAHKAFFETAFYRKSYQPTKNSIYTKLQSLLNSTFFYNLTSNKSTIDIYKELNRQNLIIFNLSKGRIGSEASEAFGRFLTSILLTFALNRATKQKEHRLPVELIIDEFQNYTNDSIEVILSEARKYNLHLTLACQMLGQNADTQLKNNILSNTAVKFVGQNSMNTLRALASEINVKTDDLKKLKTRCFYVKAGPREAYMVKVPDYLYKHIKNNYHEPKIHQFETYYYNTDEIQIPHATPQPKAEPKATPEQGNDFKPKYGLEW